MGVTPWPIKTVCSHSSFHFGASVVRHHPPAPSYETATSRDKGGRGKTKETWPKSASESVEVPTVRRPGAECSRGVGMGRSQRNKLLTVVLVGAVFVASVWVVRSHRSSSSSSCSSARARIAASAGTGIGRLLTFSPSGQPDLSTDTNNRYANRSDDGSSPSDLKD
jgi:hypothetical protein